MLNVMFTTRRVPPRQRTASRPLANPEPARRRPDLRCHGLSVSHLPVGSARSLLGAGDGVKQHLEQRNTVILIGVRNGGFHCDLIGVRNSGSVGHESQCRPGAGSDSGTEVPEPM